MKNCFVCTYHFAFYISSHVRFNIESYIDKATFLRSNAGFVLADHGQHGLEASDDPVKPAGVGVPGGARIQPGVREGHSEGDLGGGEDGALPRVLLQPGGAQGAWPVLLEVEHAATKSE